MRTILCRPAGSLIGGKGWLPAEAFDYAWGRFGCNRLRCGACGQAVQASTSANDPDVRHYECACQQYDAYGYHLLGADEGQVHELVTAWACAGHPEFRLPSTLDGVSIPGDDGLAETVGGCLGKPPFTAPEIRNPAFWVQRLYHLVQEDPQRRMIGGAVGAALSSPDAATVRAAIDFFVQLPDAFGAERVGIVAREQRERLESMADPFSPRTNLYERVLEAVEARLMVRDAAGAFVDANAVAIARQALLDGAAPSGILYLVAAHDREWFCNHAASIVRAAPGKLEFVLEALRDVPASERVRVLRNLRRTDASTSDAVLRFASTLGEPERSEVLRELSQDPA